MKNLTKKTNATSNFNGKRICTKSIHIFFKFLGLAPVSLQYNAETRTIASKNISRSAKPIKFGYSIFGCFYNIVLISLLIGINIVSIPRVIENDYPYKSRLTVTIELIEAIGGNAIIYLICLLFCIKQKTMVKLLNRMIEADTIVHDLTFNNDTDIDSNRCYFVSLFTANCLVWLGVIVSNQLCYQSAILNWFNNIVPGVFVHWFTIHYVMMVKHLEMRFQRFNRGLSNKAEFAIVEPHRIWLSGDIMADNRSFPKIIAYRKAHILLYEIAQEVADFYSLPIVFAIAFSCYIIVYNAYYAMMPFVLSVEIDGISMIVTSLFWVIAMMLPITLLATGVDSITNQMTKTSDVVHKLLARSTMSREDKMELEDFSLELLPRRVKFEASGLFPLNCTLVQSICSMVGMYLVILFQFQVASVKSGK